MSGKFKLIVSDLHLSAGRVAEGNPLEDFVSDDEFAALLEQAAAESDERGADVELIFNGDTFEMLQVPHRDEFDPTAAYPPEAYHSSSEEDSVRKMEIIIGGHPRFFEALRRFLQVGPPRRSITFIKGNHDLNLHWKGVQGRIRRELDASGPRAPLLTFEERCISREGIYVEHGNQYAEIVDRVEDMEEPHDHDRPGQLALPPGSWFVMDVFNEIERERYWIDGVKPLTALLFYALAYDFPFAVWALAVLLRALPGLIREGPLDAQPTEAETWVRQLEDADRTAEMADRYRTDEAFRTAFNDQVLRLLAPPPDIPGADIAPLTATADPVALGDRVREQVRSSLYEIAAQRAAEEGVRLVSFGHTHDASLESLPGGGAYINSGTWTWRADFSGAGKETWRDLFEHPERFVDDRRLTYVRVDYDEGGQPVGQLLDFAPPDSEPVAPEPLSWWQRFLAWLHTLFS